MRSIVFIITFMFAGAATFSYPFAGLLTWTWLSLMNPHQLLWGELAKFPFTFYTALLTLAVWLFSKDPKKPPSQGLFWMIVLFGVLLVIAQYDSVLPNISWPYFDRFIRVLVFVLLASVMLIDKVRIHAIIWLFVASIGLYAVKGGVFTIISGGGFRVWGPDKTQIYDNNAFGLAVVTIIPFCIYLWKQSANPLLQKAMVVLLVLCVAAVLGTQSRGGFISLSVLAGYFWWTSNYKFNSAVALLIIAIPALFFMPDTWFDRMATLDSINEDNSFMGRVYMWQASFQAALSNPLTGIGLRNIYIGDISSGYGIPYFRFKAVHSAYFEVMSGVGLLGFIVYMAILIKAWFSASFIRKNTKDLPEYSWMHDLATACQLSLTAFGVGAAALSMEMWEGYWLIIVMIIALKEILLKSGVEIKKPNSYPIRSNSLVRAR